MSLCDHPKAGLLWRTLQKGHLSWLMSVIPEDLKQEAALFLLGWTPEAIDADPKEFFRAASYHFYRVAVKYGYRRPRGSGRYFKTESTILDSRFEDDEEGSDTIMVALQNWRSQPLENSLEFQKRLEFCKKVLLSGDGSGRTDWYLFQGYLSGLNLNELAFLTLGEVSPKKVKERLKEIIRRIREAAGVNPNLPLPPMPKNGEVEFRQTTNLPWLE